MTMWGRVLTSLSKPISVTVPNVRPNHTPLPLTLQTNRLARLAPASAVLQTSTTTILATVTHAPSTDTSSARSTFVTPLLVDFRSKAAAVGIIPSTWSRREQQPALYETATARLIDRSLRPVLQSLPNLPPTQISVSVLSAARNADAPLDALAVNAAAAALSASTSPFTALNSSTPLPIITAARVAIVPDLPQSIIPFPSDRDIQRSALSVFAAVNSNGNILALSASARSAPAPEADVLLAIRAAVEAATSLQPSIDTFCTDVRKLRDVDGESAFPPQPPPAPQKIQECDTVLSNEETEEMRSCLRQDVYSAAVSAYKEAFIQCRQFPGKAHRAQVMTKVRADLMTRFTNTPAEERRTVQLSSDEVNAELGRASREAFRLALVRDGLRIDGRRFNEVRKIRCETGLLPGDVHGSALFERGDTQVLACSTFGHRKQIRRTEEYLDGTAADPGPSNGFFVHYTFPPFATGEYGRFSAAQNRREVGHSLLTERSIAPLLDHKINLDGTNENFEEFPYALRVSADVLGSDGSSSMASVCAGSMAIMDAGAPLREPVAGIAMGLVSTKGSVNNNNNQHKSNEDVFDKADAERDIILTDILGAEDHFGDMDMKVSGTENGITACQLDVKRPEGLSVEILERVFEQAKQGRTEILREMRKTGLERPREMPYSAPRMVRVEVNRERARNTLFRDRFRGLRAIGAACDGSYLIAGENGDEIVVEAPSKFAADKAAGLIREATREVRVGDIMNMTVADVKKTYAKLEGTLGCISGLLHVSKMQVGSEDSSDGDKSASNGGTGDSNFVPSFSNSYPDVRRLLNAGDPVTVRVIECDDGSSIIRFQLVQRQEKSEERLASEIDSILSAVKIQS